MQPETKIELEQDIMVNQKQPYAVIEKKHQNSIESLAAHPSQKTFASGSHDKSIKVWDSSTLKETATLADHKQGVWSLDYSKDGKLLLSASPDKSVLLWDSNKSSPGQKFLGHQNKVYSARFNQTNKLIASVGEGGQLIICDVAKFSQPMKKINLEAYVGYEVSWSKNEDFLFVSALGGKIVAIDAKSFNIIGSDMFKKDPELKVESCLANWKVLPGKVLCGTGQGHIMEYELKDGKLQASGEFIGHLDGCRSLNLHPQNKHLLSTGKDSSARLWDYQAEKGPKVLSNLVYHHENVTSSAFLSEDVAITGSWDQNIALWKYKDLISK